MQKTNIHIGDLSVGRRIQIAFMSEVDFDPVRLQSELRQRAIEKEGAFPMNPRYVYDAIQVEKDQGRSDRYILTYSSSLNEDELLKVVEEIEADVLASMKAERLLGLVSSES